MQNVTIPLVRLPAHVSQATLAMARNVTVGNFALGNYSVVMIIVLGVFLVDVVVVSINSEYCIENQVFHVK